MNYYIQGCAAKADKIKAAFEAKGYKCGHNCDSMNFLYYTINNHVTTTGIQSHTRQLIMRLAELGDYSELELPKQHYDISNFKPFDNVLVRVGDKSPWRADFFEEYDHNFYCFRGAWEQCIPFNEETKHLLGTTDMCDEQYINW
jgi:hypothetical protein